MCNKRKHYTTYGGTVHLLALNKKKNITLGGIYYCNECIAYHVTSKNRKDNIIRFKVN